MSPKNRRRRRRNTRQTRARRAYILMCAAAVAVALLIAAIIIQPWSTRETDALEDVAETADRLAIEETVSLEYSTDAGDFTGAMDTRGRLTGEFTTTAGGDPVSAPLVSTGADVYAEGGAPLWESAGMTGDFAGWVNVNDANFVPAVLDPTLAQIAHAARTQDASVNESGAVSLRGFVVTVEDTGDEGGTPKLEVNRGPVTVVVSGGGDMGEVDDQLAAAADTPASVVQGDDGALRVDGPPPPRQRSNSNNDDD